MSTDHKPENKKELSRIKKAGGEVIMGRVNGNLNLSRSMGDFKYKDNKNLKCDEQLIVVVPDIKVRKLTKDDQYIILGCDGVWEILSN